MRISDLFKQTTVDSKTGAAARAKVVEQQIERSKGGQNNDTVSISPLAKQFAMVSQILSEDRDDHRARVEAIKKSVTDGSYNVSSEATASSLVSYLKNEER